MATESLWNELSNSMNDGNLCDKDFVRSSEQSRVLELGEIPPWSNVNWKMDFLRDQGGLDPVLQYINQILLEENMEGEPGMFQDLLALQATERSFFNVLAKDSSSSSSSSSSPSPSEALLCNQKNSEVSFLSSSEVRRASSSNGSMSSDPPWILDQENYESSLEINNETCLARQSDHFRGSYDSVTSCQMDPSAKPNMVQSIFSDNDSILLFKRGMEEGSKFLPAVNQFIGDSAKYRATAKTDFLSSELAVNVENNEFRGRKHRQPDDSELYYRRSSKQCAAAVSVQEEDELSDKFDRVLLNHVPPEDLTTDTARSNTQIANENKLPSGGKFCARKSGNGADSSDLRALLMSCAQSIAANDMNTANAQLMQIKKYASRTGDPDQRLAILFANALEARLAGTGPEHYKALTSRRTTAADELKVYRVFHSTPFKAISVIFGNQMILEIASKATTLHIIDFGIGYGFQWPSLIQHLSHRPGGPPKLRITGIDIPQPGFRPAEVVEDAGRRLARYCKRFNVPFEYQAIATQSWETIRVEELKVTRGEVLVVNSQCRFKKLLDETVVEDSPKDAVLKLIRNLNPDIFLNIHTSGLQSSPFFLTRFREAFFFFSAIFDAIDSILPRNDEQRLKFEQDLYGPQIMNLVACEWRDRVERPEPYKHWQIRCTRAGFKILPLRIDLMQELRNRVKTNYHKDFVFDEDGYWMLLGWKGKIITATSCFVPA